MHIEKTHVRSRGARVVALATIAITASVTLLAQVAPVPPVPPAAPFAFAPEPTPAPHPPEPPDPAGFAFQVLGIGSGSFLGIGVAEIDADRAKELKLSEERGVEITRVFEDSPAEKAGLKKGDVVLEYNGQRVEGIEQFVRFVRETPPGRNAKLQIWRNGASQTIAATIASRKGKAGKVEWSSLEGLKRLENWMPDIPRAFTTWRSSMLGVDAESVDGQLAQFFGVPEGVLVRSVTKDSAAEKAGLKAGDVITKVDSSAVDSPREITAALRSRSKDTLPLTVVRDKKEMSLTVTIEDDRADRPSRRSRPVRSASGRDPQRL